MKKKGKNIGQIRYKNVQMTAFLNKNKKNGEKYYLFSLNKGIKNNNGTYLNKKLSFSFYELINLKLVVETMLDKIMKEKDLKLKKEER